MFLIHWILKVEENNLNEFERMISLWHNMWSYKQKDMQIKLIRKFLADKRRNNAINRIQQTKMIPISVKKRTKTISVTSVLDNTPMISCGIWKEWISAKKAIDTINVWKKKVERKNVEYDKS